MIRSLLNNVGSVLVALTLALMVWAVAVNEQNPPSAGTFPGNGLPVEVRNRPEGLTLRNSIEDTRVEVTIQAPSSVWNELSPASFQAFVDLEGLEAGEHDVAVQLICATCEEEFVQIQGYEPQTVTVDLEEFAQKEMSLRGEALESPADGFRSRAPVVKPPTVTVSGPQSEVDRVASVVARAYIGGAKETVVREATVSARDANGRAVRDVEIDPPLVTVEVPIEQRAGFREVSVQVVPTGTVASGYWISNMRADPATVTVRGAPETVESLPGFVQTKPVDVTGAQENIQQQVELVVPAGVSLVGEPVVAVVIEVVPIISGKTVQKDLTLRGVGDRFQAEVSPLTVDVILSGPQAILQELEPDDLIVAVDANGLGEGRHRLQPQIFGLNAQLSVKNVVPAEVEVALTLIRPSPTVTPTVTATSSPTVTPTATPIPTATGTPTPAGP